MKARSTVIRRFAVGALLCGTAFVSAAQGTPPQGTQEPEDKAADLTLPDLTSHPMAGMDVEIDITVRDGLDQEAKSRTITVTLPQRTFTNPVAPVLGLMRRDLALDARRAPEIGDRIDRAMQNFGEYITNLETRRRLQDVRNELSSPLTLPALERVIAELWQIMLRLDADIEAEMSMQEQQKKEKEEADKELMEIIELQKRLIEETVRSDDARLPEVKGMLQHLNDMIQDLRMMIDRGVPSRESSFFEEFRNQGAFRFASQTKESDIPASGGAVASEIENIVSDVSVIESIIAEHLGDGGDISDQAVRQMMELVEGLRTRVKELLPDSSHLVPEAVPDSGQETLPLRQYLDGMKSPGHNLPLSVDQESLRGRLESFIAKAAAAGADTRALGQALQAMGEAKTRLFENSPARALLDQAEALRALQDAQSSQPASAPEDSGGNDGEISPDSAVGDMEKDPANPMGQSPVDQIGLDPDGTPAPLRDVRNEIRRRLDDPSLPQQDRDYYRRLLKAPPAPSLR